MGDEMLFDRWIREDEGLLEQQAESAAEQLTVAELRILRQLPSHLSFPQIAAAVHLSPNTVKTHARSIYAKFGVSSRRAAIEHARRAGLLDPAPPLAH